MVETSKNILAVLGGILGVAATVLVLWKAFHHRTKIMATARFLIVPLIPGVNDEIEQFQTFFFDFYHAKSPSIENPNPLLHEVLEHLPASVFDKGGSKGALLTHLYFWEVNVRNGGTMEVKDLVLPFPAKGVYHIEGQPEKPTEFEREITIGSVRAMNTATVNIWSDRPLPISMFSATVLEDIHLTHSAGVVRLEVASEIYGWRAKLAGRIDGFISASILFFGIVALGVLAVRSLEYRYAERELLKAQVTALEQQNQILRATTQRATTQP
jgi:hypothetical protein